MHHALIKKQALTITCAVLLILLSLVLFKIFYPRNYQVPAFKKRSNTQYWKLPDGSTIGYLLLQAKVIKQQYPVIYLHGGPGGHITDRDIQTFSLLADSGFAIYLYDQIGSGQSARLKNISDYTVARHVEDLNEIITQLKADKVILIGQSWGSILAAMFAAAHPDKVEKIIFTSPGPIFPMHRDLAKLQPPDSFHLRNPFYSNARGNKIANNIRTNAMSLFATSFNMKLASDKEADGFITYLSYEVNKSTVCDTANILAMDAGSGFYASIMTFNSLIKVADPRPVLKNFKAPVLVVKGQCDNQKWGFTNEYVSLFQHSRLVIIPGAGHFIPVEQQALYLQTIKQFLEK